MTKHKSVGPSAGRHILFSWIGHADLGTWAASQGDDDPRVRVGKVIGSHRSFKTGAGPIQSLLDDWRRSGRKVDEVHLLSSFAADVSREYAASLDAPVTVHPVTLKDPTRYDAVFQCANETVAKALGERVPGRDVTISYFLNSGTPAMAVIWVLLGKTKFRGSFFQSFEGKPDLDRPPSVREEVIPFNVDIEYVPSLLAGLGQVVSESSAETPDDGLVGASPAFIEAKRDALLVAKTDVNVLLLGESGTGKEKFAQLIRHAGSRRNKPFVSTNCAALTESLLLAELFGASEGAFTDAKKDRKGKFEAADGGTLFLDEVGECSPAAQTALLRVLQPPEDDPRFTIRQFERIGDTTSRRVDVRLIAATNRNLRAMVASGDFREDLYYRLAAMSVRIPPLRERAGDIAPLATSLLGQINLAMEASNTPGYLVKSLAADALELIDSHHWPGNVRQLQGVLLRAAVLGQRSKLTAEDIRRSIEATEGVGPAPRQTASLLLDGNFSLKRYVQSIERSLIEDADRIAASKFQSGAAKGRHSHAAKLLGMNEQTLRNRKRTLKIDDTAAKARPRDEGR